MIGLSPEWSRLYTLLPTFTSLLSSSDWPKAWNRAFEALAGSDPFFSGATISACRFDLKGGRRELLVSYGPQAHELITSGLSLAGLGGPATEVLSGFREGEPLVSHDVQHSPEAEVKLLGRLLPSPLSRPLMLFPLLSYGRVIGAFWIERCDPAGCTTERMQWLRLLASGLSLALAARIHREEVEERDLALAVALAAQEKEKERIALDVHDVALQMLASAFQHVQAARDSRRQDEEARSALVKAGSLLREAMHELRGLMDSLRPATLDRFGLGSALEADVQELRQGGWQVDLVADPVQLPRDTETALYRVAHEALTNIRKHAGVCRVSVVVWMRESEFRVEVQDWGCGFDLASLAQRQALPSFGLLSMRKRTELLGGRFEVESRPGAGTRVTVQIPLRREGERLAWSP